MAFILYMGATVKEYKVNPLKYLGVQVYYCEECGCEMTGHGHYDRVIKDSGETIIIYRKCCKNRTCRHTEAVLPDFLLPHKQYSANEIEAVLLDADHTVAEAIDTEACVSTVRRWIRQMREEVLDWIVILRQSLAAGDGADERTETEIPRDDHSIMEKLVLLIQALPPINKTGNILGAALIYISNRPRDGFTT